MGGRKGEHPGQTPQEAGRHFSSGPALSLAHSPGTPRGKEKCSEVRLLSICLCNPASVRRRHDARDRERKTVSGLEARPLSQQPGCAKKALNIGRLLNPNLPAPSPPPSQRSLEMPWPTIETAKSRDARSLYLSNPLNFFLFEKFSSN